MPGDQLCTGKEPTLRLLVPGGDLMELHSPTFSQDSQAPQVATFLKMTPWLPPEQGPGKSQSSKCFNYMTSPSLPFEGTLHANYSHHHVGHSKSKPWEMPDRLEPVPSCAEWQEVDRAFRQEALGR